MCARNSREVGAWPYGSKTIRVSWVENEERPGLVALHVPTFTLCDSSRLHRIIDIDREFARSFEHKKYL